ncbi:MAG: O-methyltransferase [Haloarculaceae archaeon]
MTLENALPERIERYATAVGPEPDEIIEEMGARADREGFPYVGPAVGGWLAMLARLVGAQRVFEFGSGFGYSAYWFARELPDDGEIILTEIDEGELDDAREYFARADPEPTVRFEHGDAVETVEDYDGPFDVVLVDNEKDRYAAAFEAVREKVAPGGVVAADNAIAGGTIDVATLRAYFEGDSVDMDAMTAGIAEFLETVRADPEFEATILPLGEGVAVCHRQR